MVGYDSAESHEFSTRDYQLAGATSGCLTRLILQPLDVLKIRFQLQIEPIETSPVSKYHSIRQAYATIFREEGVKGLWKGHVPAQGLSVLYGLVQFACFEKLTASLHDYLPHSLTLGAYKPVYHFGCGGVSGCAATLVSQPLDVIRTRLVSQGEPKVYRGLTHAVQCMYREAGVVTFYKGLVPTLVQVFPNASFQFAFYAFFKRIWRSRIGQETNTKATLQKLVCGSMAGICAKTIVYPLDLAKKRMEVQGFESARKEFGRVQCYDNFVVCLRTICREEGLSSIYKGLRPSIYKAACSTALAFTFYESTLSMIREYRLPR